MKKLKQYTEMISKYRPSVQVKFEYANGCCQVVVWDRLPKDTNVRHLASEWAADLGAKNYRINKLEI